MEKNRHFWPMQSDYDAAIRKWLKLVEDADIRDGQLDEDTRMGINHLPGAGHYVCLYKVHAVRDWVIRCFCEGRRKPPDDIEERYEAIERFCSQNMHKVSALVPVTLYKGSIAVGEEYFPVVKMPFLQLPSLGKYIHENYLDKTSMQQLCTAWQRMVRELESVEMAHGDLDLTNVLVERRGKQVVLKLIDYDNVWISDLRSYQQTEHGHEFFQHPAFFYPHKRPYDAEMDRFSALSIYVSLKTLAVRPDLYSEWGVDDRHRLLLSAKDYRKEWQPQPEFSDGQDTDENHISALYRLAIPEIVPYVDELRESLRDARMPRRLDEIASGTNEHIPIQQLKLLEALPPPIFHWEEIDGIDQSVAITAASPTLNYSEAAALYDDDRQPLQAYARSQDDTQKREEYSGREATEYPSLVDMNSSDVPMLTDYQELDNAADANTPIPNTPYLEAYSPEETDSGSPLYLAEWNESRMPGSRVTQGYEDVTQPWLEEYGDTQDEYYTDEQIQTLYPHPRRKRLPFWTFVVFAVIIIVTLLVLWIAVNHRFIPTFSLSQISEAVVHIFSADNVATTRYPMDKVMTLPLYKTTILYISALDFSLGTISQPWSFLGLLFSIASFVLSIMAFLFYFRARKRLSTSVAGTDSSASQQLPSEQPHLEEARLISPGAGNEYILTRTALQEKMAVHPGLLATPQLEKSAEQRERNMIGEASKALAQGNINAIIELAVHTQHKNISLWPLLLDAVTSTPTQFIKHHNILQQATQAFEQATTQMPSVYYCVTAIMLYRWLLRDYGENTPTAADLWYRQGIAYSILSNMEDVPRQNNLEAANACYQIALEIYSSAATRSNSVLRQLASRLDIEAWAATQHNLGNSYSDLPCIDKQASLKAAIACYAAALEVYTNDEYPLQAAIAQHNLANAFFSLTHGDSQADLENAISAYEAALHNYKIAEQEGKTSEVFYVYRAATLNNLGNAYSCWEGENDQHYLQIAIKYYTAALEIYNLERYPLEYARTSCNLGVAYLNLNNGNHRKNVKAAIYSFKAALEVYTTDKYPAEHARTLYCLGNAYLFLHDDHRPSNLEHAIKNYQQAVQIYLQNNMAEYAQAAGKSIQKAHIERKKVSR